LVGIARFIFHCRSIVRTSPSAHIAPVKSARIVVVAIGTCSAAPWDWDSLAKALDTGIADRTYIAVIARHTAKRLGGAAQLGVASVKGARILVIALTVVPHMLTLPNDWVAIVKGARNAVIAKSLVHLAIAVVVLTVANLVSPWISLAIRWIAIHYVREPVTVHIPIASITLVVHI
jgi:hypothetical protein